MSVFDTTMNIAKPSRSNFDLSCRKMFNCDFGELIPAYVRELVPGDSFRIGNNVTVRFDPQRVPFFNNIRIDIDYFFVPYRMLSYNWSEWITGSHNGRYGDISSASDYAKKESYPCCKDDVEHDTDFFGGFWLSSDISYYSDYARPCRYVHNYFNSSSTPLFSDGLTPFLNASSPNLVFSGRKFKKYSLADYLGFPLGVDLRGSTQDVVHENDWKSHMVASVSRFPALAYNMIWNNYYRDENIQNPLSHFVERVMHRNRKKDYFTACLPWQQRGEASFIPIRNPDALSIYTFPKVVYKMPTASEWTWGSTNPLAFGFWYASDATAASSSVQGSSGSFRRLTADDSLDISQSGFGPVIADDNATSVTKASFQHGRSQFRTRLSYDEIKPFLQNLSINISDMRFAVQLQKYLERSAVGGYRLEEWTHAMYGVSSDDLSAHRPVFIGRTTQYVQTNTVTAQSSFKDDQDVLHPLGYQGGQSYSQGGNYVGTYFAKEFGVLMGIFSIMPESIYYQGVSREWLRQTRYDYFNPLFVGLSEQGVFSGEVNWFDTGSNIDVFGYQGRYNEMRTSFNQVCGDLRPHIPHAEGSDQPYYSDWTQARTLSDSVAFNQSFISQNSLYDNGAHRPFVRQDAYYKPVIVDFASMITARRPLPYQAVPGGR